MLDCSAVLTCQPPPLLLGTLLKAKGTPAKADGNVAPPRTLHPHDQVDPTLAARQVTSLLPGMMWSLRIRSSSGLANNTRHVGKHHHQGGFLAL